MFLFWFSLLLLVFLGRFHSLCFSHDPALHDPEEAPTSHSLRAAERGPTVPCGGRWGAGRPSANARCPLTTMMMATSPQCEAQQPMADDLESPAAVVFLWLWIHHHLVTRVVRRQRYQSDYRMPVQPSSRGAQSSPVVNETSVVVTALFSLFVACGYSSSFLFQS